MEFVDTLHKENVMIARVVKIFTKDQVVIFERDKNFGRMSF